MATLTIGFCDMFMLVMQPKGAIVLLPSKRHTAHLRVPTYPPFELKGHQVTLVDASGNSVWGHPPAPPARKHLVHMNDAFGCKTFLKSGLIAGAVLPTFNARVILAGRGSSLEAPEARRYPGARKVVWEFHNKVKPHKQLLTDTLVFKIPLSGPLTLRCRTESETKDFAIPADQDVHVRIENNDHGLGTGLPPKKHSQYPLREFEILYDLVRSDCARPPVPIGDYPGESESLASPFGPSTILSEEEPICAGGEDDPPDPPEVPPGP